MQNQMLQLGKYFIRELEFQYSKTVLSLSPYTKVCENGGNHMKSFKQKYLIFVILLRIPPQYKTRAILMNNFQRLYSHFLKEEFQVLKLRKPSLHQFVGLFIAILNQFDQESKKPYYKNWIRNANLQFIVQNHVITFLKPQCNMFSKDNRYKSVIAFLFDDIQKAILQSLAIIDINNTRIRCNEHIRSDI
ncbi:unnamed protein product (macronuclear) [Paramecium tetraurelia]|uniref:Uncharacterized protein n=1 Tax=Paramecium tetraurelia TaxID=5888 RepID=A0CNW7_PARTE|nr:uncharacterized protein GSPATT00038753001 [Paramecium tetraurelia]CAK72484.1 unnamed protein product [Paramecium tetraurelia]|eukprot:XP_001439881.1 hypothetical protein (macronuclear) [Paramecium tetraurelia strain d4-2]